MSPPDGTYDRSQRLELGVAGLMFIALGVFAFFEASLVWAIVFGLSFLVVGATLIYCAFTGARTRFASLFLKWSW